MQKKTTKRRKPPGSGRPRVSDGKAVRVLVVLSEEQHDYLKAKGNISAEVRRLVDQEMVKQGERAGSP